MKREVLKTKMALILFAAITSYCFDLVEVPTKQFKNYKILKSWYTGSLDDNQVRNGSKIQKFVIFFNLE